jgi:hypothetical protein
VQTLAIVIAELHRAPLGSGLWALGAASRLSDLEIREPKARSESLEPRAELRHLGTYDAGPGLTPGELSRM